MHLHEHANAILCWTGLIGLGGITLCMVIALTATLIDSNPPQKD
jgi:hypothetical protein